ncbi:hypothetical protein [Variovorax ginsengisoli]|uniref:RNA-binding protein n=1 Tax=Variovorax ginsengisoli TaxID=363844 RepID=A0ABT9S9P9_9BURK|nr:hypothetical protein [Variovorax ginsengisoli]MDP9900097.1 hypothetical protein [Variovorax ginsengisoli]
MKHFVLEPRMTATLGGAFYPTGYSFVMFADANDARKIAQALSEQSVGEDEIYLLSPETVLAQISPTVVDADDPLPSAGTEGATVRAYTKLARDGHTGLLVKTDDEKDANRMMDIVRAVPFSIAQRYRMLVIEDL